MRLFRNRAISNQIKNKQTRTRKPKILLRNCLLGTGVVLAGGGLACERPPEISFVQVCPTENSLPEDCVTHICKKEKYEAKDAVCRPVEEGEREKTKEVTSDNAIILSLAVFGAAILAAALLVYVQRPKPLPEETADRDQNGTSP